VVRHRPEGFSPGLTSRYSSGMAERGSLTSSRRIEGGAPSASTAGRTDLAAPPAKAAEQKQNDQDDDDESRC